MIFVDLEYDWYFIIFMLTLFIFHEKHLGSVAACLQSSDSFFFNEIWINLAKTFIVSEIKKTRSIMTRNMFLSRPLLIIIQYFKNIDLFTL